MIDPASIASGVVSSVATNKSLEAINEHHNKDVIAYLHLIHTTIQEARDFFAIHTAPPEDEDIYRVVPLSKFPLGAPYTPNPIRPYVRVLAGATTVLSIQGTPLGTFTYTLNPGVWTQFDFPFGAVVYLDTTNTSSSQNIWVRHTTQKP